MVRELHISAGTLYLIPLNGNGTRRENEKQAVESLIRELWGETVRKEYHPNGRPYLTGKENLPHISISHTADWAALLVSETSCGIDIEHIERDASRVAKRIAEPQEIELAGRFFPKNPALWVWCAKEAAYKAAAERRDIDFRTEIRITGEKVAQVRVQTENVRIEYMETSDLLIVSCQV